MRKLHKIQIIENIKFNITKSSWYYKLQLHTVLNEDTPALVIMDNIKGQTMSVVNKLQEDSEIHMVHLHVYNQVISTDGTS